ncbi:N-acetylmuramic acid 6-phosphate etherase [Listeria ivanovii]|uniref:N-acetylmuramic acid 6-phosphate etherase n=3 Tax=Listeria ivanovii TaxID=1638 RepID=G2ZAE0_LISIP|nr:N-acetylmuramic acid 6-phosphate etherase [Listeria ivanovii]AHI56170.1 N-acetylmuramic acid-6-phosphate etherase [Listeria ivanovii WSLC3009]AIS65601.1 N-acetylmuramic acid-6-phosphate etherase [Listeria ivanovii subsp. ivanovii]MBC1759523.1 N-acetylmuramic acid 6-phosphate etherase [Listeria ivanovii]MCJ1718649.1 N-acetylmuramic acid 6-phosphate etherase [Listeria ivanovii]MCJ1723839.1 N-acetylmuramic acid 6-phosphate etherase [Listeria ivanovii]
MLEKLTTEKRNKRTMQLDQLSTEEILAIMNQEDQTVPTTITPLLPVIQKIVDRIVEQMQSGGRLIYIGAGTSGRLGVLDAAECVPTFGTNPQDVISLIAGGKDAFTKVMEGAEDHEEFAEQDLKKIALASKDFIIGISASGRTPYVIGALRYAKKLDCPSAAISCNKDAEISAWADFAIELEVGAEILTGSTRLKAGTAQKLVLNMISTASMIGIGKVYKNLMVDVQPTNKKLEERAKRIIMEATECSLETAAKYYQLADKHVKAAIVMILTGCHLAEAEEKLKLAGGFVRKVI